MDYVAGFDGGGTKTEAVLVRHDGRVMSHRRGGCTNIQVIGKEKLKAVLLEMIRDLLGGVGVPEESVTRFVFGLAGAGRKSDQETIVNLFTDTSIRDRVIVESDAIVALIGAFENQPGIILIAGTGAICFGMSASGEVLRTGGYGYLLGDEGSGYAIGREAIIRALKSHDGRGEETSLRSLLEHRYKIASIAHIIPLVYQDKIDRMAIANLAPLVFREARRNDGVSKEIIRHAGRALGELVLAVSKRLELKGEPIRVAFIGSVFKQKKMLIDPIREVLDAVSTHVEITDPLLSPCVGAAILGLESAGVRIAPPVLKELRDSG